MADPASQFLDVPTLLEQSRPVPRNGWMRYAGAMFAVLVLSGLLGGRQSPELDRALGFLGSLTMILLVGGMGFLSWQAIQRQRDEQRKIESIEELIQLRRWPQAAALLGVMLSAPVRSMQGRVQALIYLASVLARYHRFHDAIQVQEHVLETVQLDSDTTYALKLGRAMSLLHEDRLVDADRALSELRRLSSGTKSAGLVLIEIYRDVKTGHPEEAIELFTRHQSMMRDQLGHRVADAWALVAKSYDMLERSAEAATAYANATVLATSEELSRRYPEVGSLEKSLEARTASTVPSPQVMGDPQAPETASAMIQTVITEA